MQIAIPVEIEKILPKRLSRRALFALGPDRPIDYLKSIQDFQLFCGNSPLGKPFRMTGKEAKVKNFHYEKKFCKELDAKKKTRLLQLRVAKNERL